MNKEEIKTILHQRYDYLMVDEVAVIDTHYIEAIKSHTGNEMHIKGHFPGLPVVPGAMLQEFCTQSAGIMITKFHSPIANYHSEKTKGYALGVLNKIEYAKFLGFTKPHLPITAQIKLVETHDNLFKFNAKVFQDKELKAKLKFNLVNISDKIMQ